MSIRPPTDIGLDVVRAARSAAPARSPNALGPGLARTAGTDKKKTYREFEAYVLQSFIEPMMPKNTASAFGAGTAGEVWKSMMAEQMGREFAKNGGIGIASALGGDAAARLRRPDPFGGDYGGLGATSAATDRPARFKWLPQDLATHWNEREAAAGLPRNFIATNANIESGGRAGLRDPGNSNMGLHQFARSDMRELLGYAASPLDPRASTDALVVEAQRNRAVLSRLFGRDPSGGELYVAHQQGTTGAKALFDAPNASAVDVLTGVYRSRRTAARAIRLNIPSDSPLKRQDVASITAKQFTDLWVNKFGRQAGDITPTVADAGTGRRTRSVPATSGVPAGRGEPFVDANPRFLSSNLSREIHNRFLARLAPAALPSAGVVADRSAGVRT